MLSQRVQWIRLLCHLALHVSVNRWMLTEMWIFRYFVQAIVSKSEEVLVTYADRSQVFVPYTE